MVVVVTTTTWNGRDVERSNIPRPSSVRMSFIIWSVPKRFNRHWPNRVYCGNFVPRTNKNLYCNPALPGCMHWEMEMTRVPFKKHWSIQNNMC
eukprot:scaffold168752_cov88-Attheya_sp.AAC.1